MSAIWTATVTQIGADAQDMFEAGVFILFGEPVPKALAEISVVHKVDTQPIRELAAGDLFRIGQSEVVLTAVGEIASQNLTELGHIVLYLNQDSQKLLPGAVHANGTITTPTISDRIGFFAPGGD